MDQSSLVDNQILDGRRFVERFGGEPLKNVAITVADRAVRGEAMITAEGLEGGAIYALGPDIRHSLASVGSFELSIDLRPDLSLDDFARRFARSKTSESLSNRLRKVGLSPVAVALVREALGPAKRDPSNVAATVKSLRLIATGTSPVERAISTAGGIALSELDDGFMLRRLPGVFAAGDTRHASVKRVASGVGEGSVVVHMVHQYLAKVK